MSELKLKVGKSYRDRHGRVVEIVYNDGPALRGDNDMWYYPDGRTDSKMETESDLIEEVQPEPKRRKVKWPIRGRVKRKEPAEAIYYTPDEVDMIIGNPTYAYPEAEESFGPLADAKAAFERAVDEYEEEPEPPKPPELTFTQEEYAGALRLAGIDTNRPDLFYKIAALMQETTGNPTLSQVMGVWEK